MESLFSSRSVIILQIFGGTKYPHLMTCSVRSTFARRSVRPKVNQIDPKTNKTNKLSKSSEDLFGMTLTKMATTTTSEGRTPSSIANATDDDSNNSDNNVFAVDDAQIDYWTRQYRQSILNLTNSTSISASSSPLLYASTAEALDVKSSRVAPEIIPWTVSQHMLGEIWKQQEQDNSNSNSNSNSTIERTSKSTVVVYACQECGNILFPGWKGTQLRVCRNHLIKKDSSATKTSTRRTIRRREQRKYKRSMRRKEMLAKNNDISSSSSSTTNTANNASRNTLPSSHLPPAFSNKQSNEGKQPDEREADADDASDSFRSMDYTVLLLCNDPTITPLDRNYLVIKCGRCHAKYRIKGPKSKTLKGPKQTKKKMTSTKKPSAIKPLLTSHSSMISSKKNLLPHNVMDPVTMSEAPLEKNFEALPPAQGNNRNNNKRKDPPHTATTMSSAGGFSSSSLSASKSKQQGRKKSSSMTLLEQRQLEKFGGRKKKKKGGGSNNDDSGKKGVGKNTLLSFLSSLNDH